MNANKARWAREILEMIDASGFNASGFNDVVADETTDIVFDRAVKLALLVQSEWRAEQEKRERSKDRPNLIERLEEVIACLNEIENHLLDEEATDAQTLGRIADAHGNAFGIAGEILTMVDGR